MYVFIFANSNSNYARIRGIYMVQSTKNEQKIGLNICHFIQRASHNMILINSQN